MSRLITPRLVLIAALVAATGLGVTACGKRGTLDRPAPLWGHPKDKTDGDTGDQRTTPEKKGDPGALSPDANNRTIAQDPMDGVPSGPDSGPGNPSNLIPHS